MVEQVNAILLEAIASGTALITGGRIFLCPSLRYQAPKRPASLAPGCPGVACVVLPGTMRGGARLIHAAESTRHA